MVTYVLRRLQRAWRGPAVDVQVGRQKVTLGQGTVLATVRIHDPGVLRRLLISPSLSFGEAYMSGALTVEGDLRALVRGYFQSSLVPPGIQRAGQLLRYLGDSPRRAQANARHHYDIGNDFYRLWLDPSLTYSCAYFLDEDDTLEQAQYQKREMICRKLRLQQGQTLLDIGCGWGSLMFHAVENYDVRATGITPAKEQAAYIRDEAQRRGVADKVKVIVGDWRALEGSFDRIVSVGMFEHVGYPQYQTFFDRWRRLLAPDGTSLLHTIAHSRPAPPDRWMDTYIFPGGDLPTLYQLAHFSARAGIQVMDVENLRQHYALTLQAWSDNFRRARPQVVEMFDERFARMWWLYLQGSEAGFRWGGLQLYQLVMLGPRAAWPLSREIQVQNIALARTAPN